ncbi:hypothetical protein SCP_0805910 [Sparassis crispa]|uniref:MYND-type domain-containing protein n=1 Tax=Sparassis crispa TaxID=139825 RepID=A0A401GV05_9APHY|nr:hypothetical protein SCP_0805910 [Sparassis crispa]GBE86067.1 hypothetical protein SCP_0805910 [Sparassis crispa]
MNGSVVPAAHTGVYRVQYVLTNLFSNVQLPDIQSVREDAELAPSLRESQSSDRSTPVMTDGSTGKVILDPVSDGLLYNHFLPNLFKWSFFVHTDDVPDDLLKECVWALEMFILELIESSDAQLRAMGHITRRTADSKMAYAKNAMIMHAKFKAAIHMLKPTINRAADAVTHLKHVVEVVKSTSGSDLYSGNRDLFVTYAEALLCNGEENEAQTVLERVLKVEDPSPEGLLYLVKAKALVSRVYRSHGLEQKALKHEEWLVKWFRKNPHFLPENLMQELLMPAGEPSTVLEALGGPEWLDNRQHTDKTVHRLSKQCRQCGAREPIVKLSLCSGCKTIYYCSSACQKQNWPYHKAGCKDKAELHDRLAKLAVSQPSAAQKEKDFHAWLEICNQTAFHHALGLRRDPSRGRTHIIFQEVVYTPKASAQVRLKFRILRCGVFLIADVLGEIERLMNLNAGEGMEYVKSIFDEMDSTGMRGRGVMFLVLSYGRGVRPWLGGDAAPSPFLQSQPYDPDWRTALNPTMPPVKIELAGGKIQDAENDV